jgi:hypothetical protein
LVVEAIIKMYDEFTDVDILAFPKIGEGGLFAKQMVDEEFLLSHAPKTKSPRTKSPRT